MEGGLKLKTFKQCPVCNESANQLCSACNSVAYCSIDHQKKDWKTHKSSCSTFQVLILNRTCDAKAEMTGPAPVGTGGAATGTETEKVCVASRDLKVGTVLINESPIFQIPSRRVHDNCVTCGIGLAPNPQRSAAHSCQKCQWPVCGEECSKLAIHADNECRIFTVNEISYPVARITYPEVELSLYASWARSYAFMNQQPDLWGQLMEMCHQTTTDKNKADWVEAKETMFPVLPGGMTEDSLISEIFNNIHPVLLKHGFKPDMKEDSFPWDSSFAYSKASLFSNACSPNCDWVIGGYPEFKIWIRTSHPVKKGEILTLSRFAYNEQSTLGTLKRQELHSQYFSSTLDINARLCKCKLCVDPTELGSYQSAVVCIPCKDRLEKGTRTSNKNGTDKMELGYLLPVDPVCGSDNDLWKCNICTTLTSAAVFIPQIHKIGDELLQKLNSKTPMLEFAMKNYTEMITQYKNKIVHPNHWILQLSAKLLQQSILMSEEIQNDEMAGNSNSHLLVQLTVDLLDIKSVPVTGNLRDEAVTLFLVVQHVTQSLLSKPEEILTESGFDLLGTRSDMQQVTQFAKEASAFFTLCPHEGTTKDVVLKLLKGSRAVLAEFLMAIEQRILESGVENLDLSN